MPTDSSIRKNAAESVKKMLPQGFAIAGILLMLAAFNVYITMLIGTIIKNVIISAPVSTLFSAIVTVFLQIPLILGVMRFFWRMSAGADDSVKSIFWFFSTPQKYRRSLSLQKNYILRVYISPILLYIATSVITIAERTGHGGIGLEVAEGAVLPVLNSLFTISIIVAFFMSLRYFFAPYIMFNDEGITPGEAMLISYRITKKRTVKILGFMLGYIGWAMLSIFILPLFYTMPLVYEGNAIFARYFIQINNFEIDHGRRIY